MKNAILIVCLLLSLPVFAQDYFEDTIDEQKFNELKEKCTSVFSSYDDPDIRTMFHVLLQIKSSKNCTLEDKLFVKESFRTRGMSSSCPIVAKGELTGISGGKIRRNSEDGEPILDWDTAHIAKMSSKKYLYGGTQRTQPFVKQLLKNGVCQNLKTTPKDKKPEPVKIGLNKQLKCANHLSSEKFNHLGRAGFSSLDSGLFMPKLDGKDSNHMAIVKDGEMIIVSGDKVRSIKLSSHSSKLPASNLLVSGEGKKLPIKVGDRVMCLDYQKDGDKVTFRDVKDQFYYCKVRENADPEIQAKDRIRDGRSFNSIDWGIDIDKLDTNESNNLAKVDKVLLDLFKEATDRYCGDKDNIEIFKDKNRSQRIAHKYPRHLVKAMANPACGHLDQETRCELEMRIRECYPTATWMPKINEISSCQPAGAGAPVGTPGSVEN